MKQSLLFSLSIIQREAEQNFRPRLLLLEVKLFQIFIIVKSWSMNSEVYIYRPTATDLFEELLSIKNERLNVALPEMDFTSKMNELRLNLFEDDPILPSYEMFNIKKPSEISEAPKQVYFFDSQSQDDAKSINWKLVEQSQERQKKVLVQSVATEKKSIEDQSYFWEQQQMQSEKVKDSKIDRKIAKFGKFFVEQRLKGKWRKNTNIPKFITRIMMKYFYRFAEKNDKRLLAHHNQVSSKLSKRGSNNFSISDVLDLLRDDSDRTDSIRKKNHKILSQIIRKTLRDQVIENKYIKDHQKSYMIAMKIYSLRCRSRTLAERVKIF